MVPASARKCSGEATGAEVARRGWRGHAAGLPPRTLWFPRWSRPSHRDWRRGHRVPPGRRRTTRFPPDTTAEPELSAPAEEEADISMPSAVRLEEGIIPAHPVREGGSAHAFGHYRRFRRITHPCHPRRPRPLGSMNDGPCRSFCRSGRGIAARPTPDAASHQSGRTRRYRARHRPRPSAAPEDGPGAGGARPG
jgi:hypothetical protein